MRRQFTADVTRQNLIDAFCILAEKKPVAKITISELVERAGYNRGTFYKYFRDIYDVLEEIERIIIGGVKENFRNNISPDNFKETFLTAFTKIQREQAVYFDLLLNPANKARFVDKIIAEISPVFMTTFDLPPDNIRSKYLTEIYFTTVITALSTWISNGRELSTKELSNFLGDVLADGVLHAIKSKHLETSQIA